MATAGSYNPQTDGKVAKIRYMVEEKSLLDKIFDWRLLKVDSQLAQKNLFSLYYDFIDNECLDAEQAHFIAQYCMSVQGLNHNQP